METPDNEGYFDLAGAYREVASIVLVAFACLLVAWGVTSGDDRPVVTVVFLGAIGASALVTLRLVRPLLVRPSFGLWVTPEGIRVTLPGLSIERGWASVGPLIERRSLMRKCLAIPLLRDSRPSYYPTRWFGADRGQGVTDAINATRPAPRR